MKTVQWIEHHATRIVALAGFLGGMTIALGWTDYGTVLTEDAGAVLAAGSAALHVANRALDAYRASAGLSN